MNAKASFSSVSVNDLAKAKQFYSQTLGLELADERMGLNFKLPGGGSFFCYPKDDHKPATFTVLNFIVDDIDEAAAALKDKGVNFVHYDEEQLKTDDNGIARGLSQNQGPDIAWFKDPAGNILAVLQPE